MNPEIPNFTFVRKPDSEVARQFSEVMMERRETRKRLPRERYMTFEEETFVSYALGILVPAEMERLGVDTFTFSTTMRNVHFVEEKQSEGCCLGLYKPVTGDVLVYDVEDETRKSRIAQYITILHEILHSASCQKYELYEYDTDGKTKIGIQTYRSGYSVRSSEKEGEFKLEAFDEGLTERMTWRILGQYLLDYPDIRKDLDVDMSEKELREYIVENGLKIYWQPQMLVNMLAEGLAKETKGKYSFETFARGYFTGEMMHLRVIERVFGRGSLEMIDAMIAGPKSESEYEKNNKILRYFETETSPEERKQLLEEVLGRARGE
jgi:hypothetical protein